MTDVDLDELLSGEAGQTPTLQERLERRLDSNGRQLTAYWPRNKDKKILVCIIAKLDDSALVFAPSVSALTQVRVAHDRNVASSAAVTMLDPADVGSLFVVSWDSLAFPRDHAALLSQAAEEYEPRP